MIRHASAGDLTAGTGGSAIGGVGQSLFRLIPAEHRSRFRSEFAALFRDAPAPAVEVPLRPDGLASYVGRAHRLPALQPGGEPCAVLVVRAADGEPPLSTGEDPAHQARVEAVGAMAASLVHELNQPLSCLSTYLYTARRLLQAGEVDRQELAELVGEAARQLKHATELTRRLRRFLRREPPERRAADVNGLVRDALALCDPLLREGQVETAVNLGARLPEVQVDPVQIEQVVVNLIRNAVEALRPAAGRARRLTVTTRRAEGGVEVAVGDNGPGLPPEVARRLFEPYRTTKSGGLGLGLSLCRTLVEQHGGKVWVKTHSNHGTTFFFTIPSATSGARPGEQAHGLPDRR